MNGIGGSTIEEAKDTLTEDEVAMWAEYMRRTGSLNLGKRVEQAVATMCLTLVRVHGNKRAKITDFLPDREPKVATLQEVFAMFKTAAKASADAKKPPPRRRTKRPRVKHGDA